MTDKHGYIYVLTNTSFPEYVKIGYADNVDERVAQLNRSECTPFSFKKYDAIDIFSPKKFEVLKAYLEKYGLKGGFVRFDKNSDELCICTDNYSDDITSDSWKLLDEVF